ncbi:MAG TPA: lysylphosphatidylglycerol synthase transmembrane domain-containing protein [Polyangiaceae bacterium]|nr:lysylphosphatidylglycerol synthase transmembrane domain-containing protein [Polyangiaceae bacterium]
MNRTTQRNLLRLLGPLLLLVVLYKLPDRRALWHELEQAVGWQLALAIALNGLITYFKVARWRALLKTRNIDYAFSKAWMAFTAVLYVGLLTPGRLGDVLRVRYVRATTGAPYSDGLASIAVDRICDLYVLVGFVALGMVRLGSALSGEFARVTWLGLAGAILGPLLLLIPGLGDRLMREVYRRLAKQDKDGEGMDRFLASLRTQALRGASRAVPLTALAFMGNYVQGALIASAMHVDISFIEVISMLSLASLFALVPVSVSGVGVRELLFSVLFPFLGHSSESGVGFGLLVFAVLYLPLVLYGFFCWQVAPVPLDDTPAKAKETDG